MGDPQPDNTEKLGTGSLLLGGIAGLGCFALGVGLIVSAFYELWQVSRLAESGLAAEAEVRVHGFVNENHRVAFRDFTTTEVDYSYSFKVQQQTFGGKTSSSNVAFADAFQKKKMPADNGFALAHRVGTVTVTYLPDDPSTHRFGPAERHVEFAQNRLWWVIPLGLVFTFAGGIVLFGFCAMIYDYVRGKPESTV
jgi:hypothetical protein